MNREASRLRDVGSKDPFRTGEGFGRSDIAAQHRDWIWLFLFYNSTARGLMLRCKKLMAGTVAYRKRRAGRRAWEAAPVRIGTGRPS